MVLMQTRERADASAVITRNISGFDFLNGPQNGWLCW